MNRINRMDQKKKKKNYKSNTSNYILIKREHFLTLKSKTSENKWTYIYIHTPVLYIICKHIENL